MAQEYRVIRVQASSTDDRILQDKLQEAADEGFDWVDAIHPGSDALVVMTRRKSGTPA